MKVNSVSVLQKDNQVYRYMQESRMGETIVISPIKNILI